MDFWQVLENRHCVRSFDSDKAVTNEQVGKLITAAKRAPSAGNAQDWDFKIIKDQKTKVALVDATFSGQEFIAQAPVVIVVCIDFNKSNSKYGERGQQLYAIQATAAATQNLLLAATALGLGACWVGAFNEDQVKEILSFPNNLRPVVIVPVGYKK